MKMDTGSYFGSLLLHIGSQMRDLTWSNNDPSYKAVSIFISVIYQMQYSSITITIININVYLIFANFYFEVCPIIDKS